MSDQKTGRLARLAAASLEKCFLKISRVSGGTWRLEDLTVSRGTLAEAVSLHDFKDRAAAAVYIHVKSEFPFTPVMVFGLEDVEHVSQCFLVESLSQAGAIARFDEIMLLELGNIVLNAVINHLQNALKKSAIPSVPMLLKGDARKIVGGLGAYIDPRKSFRIITASVSVHGARRVSGGSVLCVIPEEMAVALERG